MSFDTAGDSTAGGGSGELRARVSDPAVIRALAHPMRLAILERLRAGGPASATEVAQVVNASPSACSFHLRALAAAGLIEEDPDAPSSGRRRPWRAVPFELAWRTGADAETDAAVGLLFGSMEAELAVRKARAREADADYPDAWRETLGSDHLVLRLTAAEAARLRWAIRALLESAQRSGRNSRAPDAETLDVVVDYVPGWTPQRRRAPSAGGSR
ncbi:MAG: metalloregulator ArsR/SmtB family transcription factor [Actinomycetota bacterium]|nr:metalloregulator ArsR/SmtB family transcription factor [Actinomycetota bacterium]